MSRAERYNRIKNIVKGVKKHATEKGDGVLADKMRKIEIQLSYLNKDESVDSLLKECN